MADGNVAVGEGFWTPALCDGGGEAPGPASESLPRRKPRGGRALEGATYGDLRVADGAPGVGPEAVGRRLRRSEGRWRACSIVQMRGLSASRRAKRLCRGLGGHCHPGPARGWKGKRS